MSGHHLRKDNTCQNCGNTVIERFCGKCGQENIETRQSFGHLIRHFAEDLTHYDSNFWLTMRYLLFRPAYLTKVFLQGKRNSFVPPVRLYIFISFVTFLLPYIIPDTSTDAAAPVSHVNDPSVADTIEYIEKIQESIDFKWIGEEPAILIPNKYRSVEALDSAQMMSTVDNRMSAYEYWINKKYIPLQKYSSIELGEKFGESFAHNFPKALFFYMPLFALVLWGFHNKKRWIYFDHAIFTLHYFSFILLVFNVITLAEMFPIADKDTIGLVFFLLLSAILLTYFLYFFIAHKKMYEGKLLKSVAKSIVVYAINMVLFAAVLFVLGIFSIYSIH